MKLKNIGNNQSEINLDDGTKILISYETPVAAFRGEKYYRTSTQWSATTTRHITSWLGENVAFPRPQGFFDELLKVA